MKPVAVAFLVAFVGLSALLKMRLLGEKHVMLPVGSEAPAFTLRDTQGDQVDLRNVAKGHKMILVTFWATWCAPCRIELPDLEKLYTEQRDAGLEILAVNEDRDRGALADYLKERSLPFPVLIDEDGKVAEAYGVEGFPTAVLINRDERIVWVESGFAPSLSSSSRPSCGRRPPMGDPAIGVDAITKTFGGGRHAVAAVRDLSLTVEPGTVVAFVGPNGAGKTTTIYALLGFLTRARPRNHLRRPCRKRGGTAPHRVSVGDFLHLPVPHGAGCHGALRTPLFGRRPTAWRDGFRKGLRASGWPTSSTARSALSRRG